jgi:hypothetical protein
LGRTRTAEQFQNSIEKTVERVKIDTPNTQIQNCSFSWLGTGTSLKSGGANQFKLELIIHKQYSRLTNAMPIEFIFTTICSYGKSVVFVK